MALFQKLQAWQDEHEVSDQELADKLSAGAPRPVHRTTISRAKRGLRMLGMDLQLKLQKITKIPPSEWADFYAQTVHLRGAAAARGQKKRQPAEAEAA